MSRFLARYLSNLPVDHPFSWALKLYRMSHRKFAWTSGFAALLLLSGGVWVWLHFPAWERKLIGPYVGDPYGSYTALVALIAVAAAFWAYLLQSRQERNIETLRLFISFNDLHMRKIRDDAWRVRSRWYRLPEDERASFRERILIGVIPLTVADAFPMDEPHEQDWVRRWSPYDMLQFFSTVALMECDKLVLQRPSFYYPEWRSFLWDIVEEYEKRYAQWTCGWTSTQKRFYPRRQWKENLTSLDQLLKMPKRQTCAEVDPIFELLKQPTHEEIAKRAILIWKRKGMPLGSAEEDWLQAERELVSRQH